VKTPGESDGGETVRLGVLDDSMISMKFGGGGAVHVYEVVTRLAKRYEIIYFPTAFAFVNDRETLEKRTKALESLKIRVADAFFTILEKKEKFEAKGLKRYLFRNRMAKELTKYYAGEKVDFLYDPNLHSPEIFYFNNGIKFGITLHEPPFYKDSLTYLRRLIKFYGINPYTGKGFHTRFLYNELIAKPTYRKLLKINKPTFIAGVSEAPLKLSGLKGEVIRPGNAFDHSLLKHRNNGKEDYVVFWSRLNQDKGIQEIPEVLRLINKHRRTKLILMGKFFDKYNYKRFWSKVRKYGLDVEYLGFVEREKLNSIVSKARLLLYPSHVDGFSLVVLEALALGTPVVAYDIPAITSVYGMLNAVRIVREFDVASMANEALKVLSLSESQIIDLMNDPKLLSFLELHSSWDNVANAIEGLILRYSGQEG
jgi:glycosyltransferase involved in cell wall biosynthesis